MSQYSIKTGFPEMDFDKVTSMLKEVWWSPGIKKNEVIKGAQNSALVVGAFNNDNEQIGYARVISDKTRFAYISDVIVDEKYRKQGIGRALIDHILLSNELKDVYQWLLLTRDAHGVYRKSGFTAISNPEGWMEIWNKRPER